MPPFVRSPATKTTRPPCSARGPLAGPRSPVGARSAEAMASCAWWATGSGRWSRPCVPPHPTATSPIITAPASTRLRGQATETSARRNLCLAATFLFPAPRCEATSRGDARIDGEEWRQVDKDSVVVDEVMLVEAADGDGRDVHLTAVGALVGDVGFDRGSWRGRPGLDVGVSDPFEHLVEVLQRFLDRWAAHDRGVGGEAKRGVGGEVVEVAVDVTAVKGSEHVGQQGVAVRRGRGGHASPLCEGSMATGGG